MTRPVLILFSFVALALGAATAHASLSPERIAVGNYPDICVAADGNVHVIYVRDDEVFTRSRDALGQWTAEQRLPVPATNVERSDPEIAVDGANRLHVFCGATYARESDNGWDVIPVPMANRDTALAVDSQGDAYICFRGGTGEGDLGVLRIAAESDIPETLSDPDVFGGRGTGYSDHVYGHIFAGAAPGEIHIVYRHHEAPLRCGYRYTLDGGVTWGGGGIVDDDFEAPSGGAAPDGSIYAITGQGRVFRRVAAPAGFEDFGRAVPATRRDLPAIAADGAGALYAVAFGGAYNIYRGGKWRGPGQLPGADGFGIGAVEVASGTGAGAWIIWESGNTVSKDMRGGRADIWLAQVGPYTQPETPPATENSLTSQHVGQWDRFETAVSNSTPYDNPFREVSLQVTYTRPDGSTVDFWGFHDGGETWRLRFMPDQLGTWHYSAEFSDGSPGQEGSFDCVPSDVPGLISREADNPIWFGYLSGRHELIRSLHVGDRFFASNWDNDHREVFLDWLKGQGYNTLSVASHYLNRDAEGRGRGWDTPALWPLDPAEYTELEGHLDELARREILVFPFAGFFGRGSNFPRDPADQELYLRYSIARFGPYWNLLFNVGGPEPRLGNSAYLSMAEIHHLGQRIRDLDVFGHPLSVHNATGPDQFRDAPWLSYGTLQGPKTTDRDRLARGLLESHHHAKPLFAQETLWAGNMYHKDEYTETDLRKNAFVIHMCASVLNFGDMDGNSSSGFSGTIDLDTRHQEWHDIVTGVWDFFEGVPYYRMRPRPDLVNAGWCLADAGTEYLVYLDSATTVDVAVENGPYLVQWIDARDTLLRYTASPTQDGQSLTPPEGGDDWLLRLRKPTPRFAVNDDNTGTLLGDAPFLAKGLRVSNALISEAETRELVGQLDTYRDHGLNMISVFLQGSRFGDLRGYREDGTIDPVYAARLGSIIEAAAERDMAVLVGCLYYGTSRGKWTGWSQADAERAIANTVAWLSDNGYRNVLVDVNNEHMGRFDDAALIRAGKAVDPDCVIATSGSATPENADLSLHHGSPVLPEKYYIQTEGTLPNGGEYWGAYSKQPGYYNYINIGIYGDGMKQRIRDYTDSYLEKGQGFVFASTWLQCTAPHGPMHYPGGGGSPGNPGVRWWMEHIRDNWTAE